MTSVGAYEAKTHLPELLQRVAKGERITITRHGVPVAVLVPPHAEDQQTIDEAVEALKRFRCERKRGRVPIDEIKDMIEEGRM